MKRDKVKRDKVKAKNPHGEGHVEVSMPLPEEVCWSAVCSQCQAFTGGCTRDEGPTWPGGQCCPYCPNTPTKSVVWFHSVRG